MTRLGDTLDLDRCPHCGVDRPNLSRHNAFQTKDSQGGSLRFWSTYICGRCGGVVSAWSHQDQNGLMIAHFPQGSGALTVDESVPERARQFLTQSFDSRLAPAGMVMLAASAVDAMLKGKGYKKGTLYERIDQAAKDHVITHDMAKWAHSVRLDANDQRHADEDAPLPNAVDADRALSFSVALAQFMYVLPAMVTRGINEAAK